MPPLSTREFSNMVAIDALLLHLASKRKPRLVFPTKGWAKTPNDVTEEGVYKKFKGAHVFEPVAGIHRNVINLDYSSMYPSIIRSWNMGMETWRPDGSGDIKGWKGSFVSEPESVLAEMLAIAYEERKKAKAEMVKHDPDTPEYTVWFATQYAWKVLMNAAYGTQGSRFSRYYNKDVAENVTQIGQELIKSAAKIAEDMGFQLIYGDTDSVLLRVSDEVKLNPEMLPEIGDILADKLADYIRNYCQKTYGIRRIELDIEVAKIYRTILFTEREEKGKKKGTKKRYAGLVVWDGKPTDYMEIKGFEARRHDWCDAARDMQRVLLRKRLEEEPMADILAYCAETRKRLFSGEMDDKIATFKGLNKRLEAYKVTPPHLRAARMMIAAGYTVRQGDRIGYVKWGKKPEQLIPYMEGMDIRKILGNLNVSPEKAYRYLWEHQFLRIMERLEIKFEQTLDKWDGTEETIEDASPEKEEIKEVVSELAKDSPALSDAEFDSVIGAMGDVREFFDEKKPWTVLQGDCRHILKLLPDNSVQVCITSPPYWGLRDYGLARSIWGGNSDCKHEWESVAPRRRRKVEDVKNLDGKQATNVGTMHELKDTNICSLCGAWKGTLGMEPTPEMYAEHLVEIYREVRRVLKDDGMAWLNLGDTYATHASGGKAYAHNFRPPEVAITAGIDQPKPSAKSIGLKEKDLVGIPWMVAKALQADGWWLRSDVVWDKRNPMPESVNGWRWEKHRARKAKGEPLEPCQGCQICIPNDGFVLRKGSWRPTASHEYIFLLAKSAIYFGDADAVRENYETANPTSPSFRRSGKSDSRKDEFGGKPAFGSEGFWKPTGAGRNKRNVWRLATKQQHWEFCKECMTLFEGKERSMIKREKLSVKCPDCGYKKHKICPKCEHTHNWVTHFAQYPMSIVEPCVLAGTSEKGNCSECGAPWARVIERSKERVVSGAVRYAGSDKDGMYYGEETKDYEAALAQRPSETKRRILETMTHPYKTVTWLPTCSCNTDSESAIVLDIFNGAGTTGLVALKHGRRYIGIDLNPEYVAVSRARLAKVTRDAKLEDFGG